MIDGWKWRNSDDRRSATSFFVKRTHLGRKPRRIFDHVCCVMRSGDESGLSPALFRPEKINCESGSSPLSSGGETSLDSEGDNAGSQRLVIGSIEGFQVRRRSCLSADREREPESLGHSGTCQYRRVERITMDIRGGGRLNRTCQELITEACQRVTIARERAVSTFDPTLLPLARFRFVSS
jgi:hypothetical protein